MKSKKPNNKQFEGFEVFMPVEEKEARRWSQFEGVYYGWNPTWNYEFLGSQSYETAMFEAHKQRLTNASLKEIHYCVLPKAPEVKGQEITPLLSSLQETKRFFTRLLTLADKKAFFSGKSKYRIYQLLETNTFWKNEINSILHSAVSFFIGKVGSEKIMLLFINSPPFMLANGTHNEAFWTNNVKRIKLCESKVQEYINACQEAKQNNENTIYTVDDLMDMHPKVL